MVVREAIEEAREPEALRHPDRRLCLVRLPQPVVVRANQIRGAAHLVVLEAVVLRLARLPMGWASLGLLGRDIPEVTDG